MIGVETALAGGAIVRRTRRTGAFGAKRSREPEKGLQLTMQSTGGQEDPRGWIASTSI
jgi:hypothetical protein